MVVCSNNHRNGIPTRKIPMDARSDLHGNETVAADGKKVIVNADHGVSQRFSPDPRKSALQFVARNDMLRRARRCCLGRIGQRLPVELSVGGQRQPFHFDEAGGDHVTRQAGREPVVQDLRHGAGFTRNEIGRKILVCSHPMGDDHGLPDAGMQAELCLDLTELDAVAAQLHLMVATAEIFEGAVARAIGRGRRCDKAGAARRTRRTR